MTYAASQTTSKVEHLQRISCRTVGILFFGTPHRGSPKARLFSKVQRVVSRTVPDKVISMRSHLVAILHHDSILQEISNEFAPFVSRIMTFNFWEMKKSDLFYTWDYIVGESSAAPIGGSTGRAGILADHREMCKFDGHDSPGLQVVVDIMRRCSRTAIQRPAAHEEEDGRKLPTAIKSIPTHDEKLDTGMRNPERIKVEGYMRKVELPPPYVAQRQSGREATCICVVIVAFLVSMFIIQLSLSYR